MLKYTLIVCQHILTVLHLTSCVDHFFCCRLDLAAIFLKFSFFLLLHGGMSLISRVESCIWFAFRFDRLTIWPAIGYYACGFCNLHALRVALSDIFIEDPRVRVGVDACLFFFLRILVTGLTAIFVAIIFVNIQQCPRFD